MSVKMSSSKILRFASFCLLSAASFFPLYAESKTIILGGKDGCKNLSYEKNIEYSKGKFGWECVELATNSRRETEYTDLLLDFEKVDTVDKTGNYNITANGFSLTKKAKMGKKAALSTSHTKGLKLKGNSTSLFGSSGETGSFSIEFWLCPSIAENGEIVLSWRSSRTIDEYVVYQMITASFFNNHLEWKFSNVFDGYTANQGELSLKSYHNIIPNTWAHHVISFDEETGLVEYRINGKIEDLKYATKTGHERGGSIFMPTLGVAAEVELCPLFTGSIDDFRIVRTNILGTASSQAHRSFKALPKDDDLSQINYDDYKLTGGRIESQPLMVNPGSVLESVDAIISEPKQTAVQLFVRAGDNYFNWTDSYPEWKSVSADGKVEGIRGQFFQVAADLYPDGNGKVSPSITQIKLNYSEMPLPLPPFKVFASAGNGSVTLSWSHSLDDSVGGYYLYYGTRPGEYLGVGALQGSSPVDAGNISTYTITGLKNGTVYYFAIATYSNIDKSFIGTLSNEVSARPLE